VRGEKEGYEKRITSLLKHFYRQKTDLMSLKPVIKIEPTRTYTLVGSKIRKEIE
jgi:hypothetical protein